MENNLERIKESMIDSGVEWNYNFDEKMWGSQEDWNETLVSSINLCHGIVFKHMNKKSFNKKMNFFYDQHCTDVLITSHKLAYLIRTTEYFKESDQKTLGLCNGMMFHGKLGKRYEIFSVPDKHLKNTVMVCNSKQNVSVPIKVLNYGK